MLPFQNRQDIILLDNLETFDATIKGIPKAKSTFSFMEKVVCVSLA